MKKHICIILAFILVSSLLLFANPLRAADFSFQPRAEVGIMQYAFESGSISATIPAQPAAFNTGFNFTQEDFEYSDAMLVLGVGTTFYVNNFFLDVSAQSASGGNDSAMASFSGYQADETDADAFIAAAPLYQADFDRMDLAVSVGYAFSGRFSVFAGYKKAETEFDATYEGLISTVFHQGTDDLLFDTMGGRISGEAGFTFKYDGPFVGAVQGWEFGFPNDLSGVLTANLALAYLEGEVTVDRRTTTMAINWAGGIPMPETVLSIAEGGISNRLNTQGDALGVTIGLGWVGTTAVDGLTYSLNVSGYRYEFESEDGAGSDINETVLLFKGGLSYLF